jgi:pantothenate kinase
VPPDTISLDEALAQAASLAGAGRGRTILGITGAPGAGKSTLAEQIRAHVGPRCRVVPMDGFHLAQSELVRLGRTERKGAIDTFDVAGYVALLRRLRDPHAGTVYAPRFDRRLDEPIASAIAVEPDVELVVTEGNYLLAAESGWSGVAALLDRCWFVAAPEGRRLRQLTARHEAHGKSPKAARAWARGTDQRNADLVDETRHRADALVLWPCERI